MIRMLGRAARSLAVLVVVVALTYVIFYLGPADPALSLCGRPCAPEDLEAARAFMGFDSPWWSQLGAFIAAIFAGRSYGAGDVAFDCAAPCLGYSFQLHQPVSTLIGERLPVSFAIAVGAIVLQTLIGVAAGAWSARRPRSLGDRAVTGASVVAASAPPFVVGLLAIVLFAFTIELLPTGGYVPLTENFGEWLRHLILPWLVLAFLNGAVYARLVRSSMIEQLGLDYIRTARAAGLSERRIGHYALRNLALPVTALVALDTGALLGGTVITERVFGLPGMGALLLDATATTDLPVIVGTTLVGAVLIVAANLAADLLAPLLDRRLASRRRFSPTSSVAAAASASPASIAPGVASASPTTPVPPPARHQEDPS